MTTLVEGTRLGPYLILEPAGAGGMGEVYKASDTRLDRTVAIKVLPRHWAANAEMRQRFEREAQMLASLNHPHICVLHDIGSQEGADFLVMEYLEGETLATRIERGAVPLDEALKIGLEIADALDKAHRKGVVHRDLKPSNVMLTKSGTKLLDFGLAKFARLGSASSPTDSPTALTFQTGKDLTTPGTILGTLQYMAPEQLEGLEADARTDIFSFGALFHEMVTGKKTFEAKSRVLLISAIASMDPPPLSTMQPASTPALDHVVKTCLAKEPADRWQTARDLLAELEFVAGGGAETTDSAPVPVATQRRLWLNRGLLTAAGLLAGAAVASAAFYMRGASASEELRFRIPIQLTAETRVAGGLSTTNPANTNGYQGVSGIQVFNQTNFAISPDGRSIAFVARQNNRAGPESTWFLYVRPVGSVTPARLALTENATQPFWSADGRSIAFVAGGKLKRVEASGGPPQEICPAVSFYGGAWNKDGVILFGSIQGLQRVPAEGGKPEVITHLGESETGHYWPHFLPDERHFLYTVWSSQAANRAIMAGTLDSPQQKTKVLPVGSNAGYSEPGYLVFHRESAVFAQTFNPTKLSVSGEPVRVADEITYDGATGMGNFSVSVKGALAYFYSSNNTGGQAGAGTDLSEWQFSWISRSGQIFESVGPPGAYRGVDVSPDAKRVAVHRHDANGGDIVVFEPRGSDTRLTLDASQHNSSPVWSPDGNQIVFASLRNSKWSLYKTLSTRSGSQELLYESDLQLAPMSWSPDGKRIVFWVQDPKTAGDIWVLTLEDKKAAKLIATAANEIHAQISPDGKWIAYTDNSKDDRNEIYVQPFPSGTDRYQISNNGGDWPRWRGDSKELFYHSIGSVATPGLNAGAIPFAGTLYSASIGVNASGALEPGAPQEIEIIPALNLPHSGGSYHTYAVDPKGDRFLVMQYVQSGGVAVANTQIGPDTFSGLTVALNWAAALKK
jgi:serine/threonine protein kinase/dipeptidyl aminopeptidase/acylaminoacyl peptidase